MLDLNGVDAETTATPLYHMGQNLLPQDGILDMFLGNIGGCLGETSALLLLIGLVYLLIRNIISLRIPVAFVGTVAVLTFLFPQGGQDRVTWMAAQILSGGLMLGAIFMATDYVTSPITKLGQVVYGIGCGVLTVVIRYFGGYPEGVSYAILIMNCCVVLLDRIGRPKKFGSVKKEVAAK
jgi:electron transport complex protein RnfD